MDVSSPLESLMTRGCTPGSRLTGMVRVTGLDVGGRLCTVAGEFQPLEPVQVPGRETGVFGLLDGVFHDLPA